MSSLSIQSNAPGKILWIGGYSVLEKGNSSLVTAVASRVGVTVDEKREATGRSEITLASRDYNFEINGYFNDDSSQLVFDEVPPEAKFASSAVEVCLNYIAAKKIPLKNFKVTALSDPEFGAGRGKSGLGSSAAVTVACVGGVLALHELPANLTVVHNLAQIAHSLAQGKVGSGFDIAAACFGSCSYSRYSPQIISALGSGHDGAKIAQVADSKWDYSLRPIEFPKDFHVLFAKTVGRSASTTEMVKKVNAWKAAMPDAYAKLVCELNSANVKAITALQSVKDKASREQFVKYFEAGRELSRKLGEQSGAPIELPEFSELIRASMLNGAFVCKLPGAGGGDGIAAICIGEENKKKLAIFWKSYSKVKLEILNIDLGRSGLVVQTPGHKRPEPHGE